MVSSRTTPLPTTAAHGPLRESALSRTSPVVDHFSSGTPSGSNATASSARATSGITATAINRPARRPEDFMQGHPQAAAWILHPAMSRFRDAGSHEWQQDPARFSAGSIRGFT